VSQFQSSASNSEGHFCFELKLMWRAQRINRSPPWLGFKLRFQHGCEVSTVTPSCPTILYQRFLLEVMYVILAKRIQTYTSSMGFNGSLHTQSPDRLILTFNDKSSLLYIVLHRNQAMLIWQASNIWILICKEYSFTVWAQIDRCLNPDLTPSTPAIGCWAILLSHQ